MLHQSTQPFFFTGIPIDIFVALFQPSLTAIQLFIHSVTLHLSLHPSTLSSSLLFLLSVFHPPLFLHLSIPPQVCMDVELSVTGSVNYPASLHGWPCCCNRVTECYGCCDSGRQWSGQVITGQANGDLIEHENLFSPHISAGLPPFLTTSRSTFFMYTFLSEEAGGRTGSLKWLEWYQGNSIKHMETTCLTPFH